MRSLDIICPVYREEEAVKSFHERLSRVLDTLADRYACHVLYVLDPSPDASEAVLRAIAEDDPRVEVLVTTRRFGHQAALIAGMDNSSADAVVMLDSDLQHPPELIPELVRQWEDGAEIVQTIREDGKEIGWLKRATSRWFYASFMRIGNVELPAGAADYRLLSARVVQVFRDNMREHNPFLRGLVSWVGFRTVYVGFASAARERGRSKYNSRVLFNFALNGICSFSKLPLRFCIGVGLVVSGLSVLSAIVQVGMYLFSRASYPGWASLFSAVSFIGGIQLFFLGVIGEYIALIFDEVKGRPVYLIHHRFGAGRGQSPEIGAKIAAPMAQRWERAPAEETSL